MRNATIPTALEMRRLKYDPTIPEATRDEVARALREAGRRAEAILLYEGRANHPSLEEDRAYARDHGTAFHLFLLKRMGAAIDDADLRACAAAAERSERWYDAHRCYGAVADAEGLARVAERLPGYKTAVPSNKPVA